MNTEQNFSRRLGLSVKDGRHCKVVDKLQIHGRPLTFRQLCEQVVPTDTRYVVLDLDRTIHLGRNLGELLGWELTAHLAYGAEKLERFEHRRSQGRFALDWRSPAALGRYLWMGTRFWAYPGLYYLAWGKIASRFGPTRRRAFLTHGPEQVQAIQSIPQTALLQQLALLPAPTLRKLAEAVWRRQAPDSVLDQSDLHWLRAHAPFARIILSSASPRPMLEVAARELGVDDFISTEVLSDGDFLTSPLPAAPPLQLSLLTPERICPPSRYRINSSHHKLAHLVERYPDFLAKDVVRVGITDNGYNEDQCWSEFFTQVADINSTTPFAPIVTPEASVREIHSARVLTRRELQARSAGDTHYLDARRAPEVGPSCCFDRAQLEAGLQEVLAQVEERAAGAYRLSAQLHPERARLAREMEAHLQRMDQVAEAYNDSSGACKVATLKCLEEQVGHLGRLRKQLCALEQPLSQLAFELAQLLERSRAGLSHREVEAGLEMTPKLATAPSA